LKLLEAIQKGASFLEEKGVESARLNVELLLEEILKIPRLQLYMEFGRELDDSQTQALREAIQRRGRREPLQHIIGYTEFCGLRIDVNPHVLIPRPETEQLAELAANFLKDLQRPTKVLEIGTGSGCLAIAVAHQANDCSITTVDVSSEALSVARSNAERHQLTDRIKFLNQDGLKSLSKFKDLDLLVSNPPYIPSADIQDLDPEVRDHDPRLALDGGDDGLDFYRSLAEDAPPCLNEGGRIMLEFGDGQGPELEAVFRSSEWQNISLKPDFSGKDRFLVASRPHGTG